METIALTPSDIARFWSKVEKTDGCWLWQAALVRKYGMFRLVQDGKQIMRKAHRIAYQLIKGPVPNGMRLDHTCHVEACVNPDHLRPVTAKQNSENRAGANANSKSGVRGVSWNRLSNKWIVTVGHNGKRYKGGDFTDLSEATAAASALRAKLFTHSDADAA